MYRSKTLILLICWTCLLSCKTKSTAEPKVQKDENKNNISFRTDTSQFKTIGEIQNYYQYHLDSISELRGDYNNIDSIHFLDSIFYYTQWNLNSAIYFYLKNHSTTDDDLKGLLLISRARNITSDEKLNLFNSFPLVKKESELGKLVWSELNNNLKKERINVLSKKGLAHQFYTDKGLQISLNDINSDYIFLEFWASWCSPCRVENRELDKYYDFTRTYSNLKIVGVSVDRNQKKWLNAINQDNTKLFEIQISDLQGWNSYFLKELQIDAIPYNILLQRNGNIVATNIQRNNFIEIIEKVIKK